MGPGIPQFSVGILTYRSYCCGIKNCFPLMPCRIGGRGKIGSSTSVCARSDKRILASPLIKQAVQADRPFGRRGVRPQIVFHNRIMIGRCRREIILSRNTRTQGIGIIRIVILVRIDLDCCNRWWNLPSALLLGLFGILRIVGLNGLDGHRGHVVLDRIDDVAHMG